MNKIEPRTLKGFRDFLPKEARKRQYVIETLRRVFESYGFEPLETPALEYEDILLGKYGEEGDKLMYRFVDNGGRKVALRYDQTVPLARVVAQFQNELPFPFKRYQIQNVWRADNTQKGRFREFLQCDIDVVGTSSLQTDVELLEIIDVSLKKLGFGKYTIKINSRELLFKKIEEIGIDENLKLRTISIIDKVEKIGWQQMDDELLNIGIPQDKVSNLNSSLSITQYIEQDPYLDGILKACKERGIENVQPKLYLARGLDYYTGLIIEVEIEGFNAGSVGGGGRYDNLIGMFENNSIPAVGFAFGFDRLMEAMEEQNLFPKDLTTTKVLVTVPTSDLENIAIKVGSLLRSYSINTEVYFAINPQMDKQFKYADNKEIPYVVVPINENEVELRKKTGEGNIDKETINIDHLIEKLQVN